jgi:replicative DNA helicase
MLLPKNDEAERALIASLLERPELAKATVMALHPEDLTSPVARALVGAFVDTGETDRVGLASHAADRLGEGVPRVLAYIEASFDVPHEPENVAVYAEWVNEIARRRRLVRTFNEGITQVLAGQQSSSVIAATVERLKDDLDPPKTPSLSDAVDAAYGEIVAFHENPLPPGAVRGVSTGLRDLDLLTGGLEPALYIVGARASVGKTALGTKIALEVAQQFQGTDKVVVIFTNEMSPSQMLTRMACSVAGVRRDAVRQGRLTREELERYFEVLAKIRELPLEIIYTSQVSTVLARSYSDPQPGLIVVDYLNKMNGGIGENRNQNLGAIASMLFDVAAELQVPLLLLAQLNRDIKFRSKGALPLLTDLRDSGELENIADVVLLLHREAEGEDDSYDPHRLMVIKRKDRLGGGQHDAVDLLIDNHGLVADVYRHPVPEGQYA